MTTRKGSNGIVFKVLLAIFVVAIGIFEGHVQLTRFTHEDGAKLERRIIGKLETDYPPHWLLSKVDEIKVKQDATNALLQALTVELAKHIAGHEKNHTHSTD